MKFSASRFLAIVSFVSLPCWAALPPAPAADVADAPKDNEEVARLYNEDQNDRQTQDGKPIDWQFVGPRDEVRRKRVMSLYASGELKTGHDYFNAGMILQHGTRPEDYLLCHELCVTAVFKATSGDPASWVSTAKWLAAASEDRFLLSIGRGQRFGTQFTSVGRNQPWHLDKMEPGVSDVMRKIWGVPVLDQAKERERQMNSR